MTKRIFRSLNSGAPWISNSVPRPSGVTSVAAAIRLTQAQKARWNTTDGLRVTPEGIEFGATTQLKSSHGAGKRTVLPHLWLRDNCRCVHCVNQDTVQRNFNTFDVPKTIRPVEAAVNDQGLSVTWDHEKHRSEYSWDFICHYLNDDSRDVEPLRMRLWVASDHSPPPTVDYAEVMDPSSEKGVATLTNQIRVHGFVFVANTPVSPEETEKLLERIAFIRITHYGGFYDFIPDLAMADTAYTNLALPAHTDTTYFTEPAGLQAFHLLSHKSAPSSSTSPSSPSSPEAAGGQSLLVDGFKAAAVLQVEDPRAYEILSKVRLPWHASGNKGIAISPDRRYPVLEVEESSGMLHRVRWNNDDRGVVPFDSEFSPDQWYEAARKWDGILRRKEMEFWKQLQPGQTLIFDNWRVLHGRSAFEGVRRICGAYINRDDFVSRWRNTNFSHEEVLSKVIG